MKIYNNVLSTIAKTSPFILALQSISCVPDEQSPTNVLFLSVDDLRPALRCYGDTLAITPNIDALARDGVLFSNHYVQIPSCVPSRASLLTGLRPDEVKVTNHATHFRNTWPDVVTLPQLFKNTGYTSIGLGKIFHPNDSISWHEQYLFSEIGNYILPENIEIRRNKAASIECVEVEDSEYKDGQITYKAIEYLRSFRESNTPFFLGVGYFKPHLPFTAPRRYWDLYDREDFRHIEQRERPENAPDIAFHNWQELRGYMDIPSEGPLTAEKEMELRHGYYACVSYIDAQVGKILNTLDELGLRENTVIVFWGDHGFHLGEQALWCKSTNFELSAHAPLIISAPGAGGSGVTTDAIVESLDLYPTLIDLCGISSEGDLSGRSLRPLLEDPESEWENVAFNQFARPYGAAIGGRIPKTHMGYSVRIDSWRYTAWYNLDTGIFEYPELYSFQESSIPSQNVAGYPEYSEIESKLHNMVQQYQAGNY